MMSSVRTVLLFCITWITVVTVDSQASQGTRVVRVGNEVSASSSGIDAPGATFLLNNVVLVEGVVFAFSAFFRSQKPARLQIWRETNDVSGPNSRSFRLLWETRVIPSVNFEREDVYIVSKLTEKCVNVKSGDRLGVYIEEEPAAVAYKFNPLKPSAFSHLLQNTSQPNLVGQIVKFDTLTFPYDFSVAAYVDTQASNYSDSSTVQSDCPRGLLISDNNFVTLSSTTMEPITGRPGATGAAGPIGATGPAGIPGSKGDAGMTGFTGLPGSPGSTGATGRMGPAGSEGAAGATGARGPVGPQGAIGPKGDKGEPGPPGNGNITVISGQALEEDRFFNKEFMFNYLIWLIVLSAAVVLLLILVIILCCCLPCCRCSKKPPPEASFDNTSYQHKTKNGTDSGWLSAYDDSTLSHQPNVQYATLNKDGKSSANGRVSESAPTDLAYVNEVICTPGADDALQ